MAIVAACVAATLAVAGISAAVTVATQARPAAAPSPGSGAAGTGTVDTTGFPTGGVGIFTDTCTPNQRAANDPILMPGMTGDSMQHDFFGNTGTIASTTPPQLVGGTTTCSTAADASAYWTPVLYQAGTALTPSAALIYWRTSPSSSSAKSVATVPAGLTLIAGNEGASTPQGRSIAGWTCAGGGGTAPKTSDAPHDCAAGQKLRLVMTFPNCWNGTTLSGKTQQNAVYADATTGTCPASHPVHIPQIVFHVNYSTSSAANLALSIAPDATGPVTTAHADFMNGWTEPTLTADVAACVATHTKCGPVHGADAVPSGGRRGASAGARKKRAARS